MKNIIVTGGAGFVGANLALTLQEKYPEANITVVDDFSLGNFKNLYGFRGDVVQGDITAIDYDEHFKEVDAIFHQAAITDTTVMNQKLMMEVNTNAFRKILNFAIKKDAKFVYASSAATYGNTPAPMVEHKSERPENIYGFSKLIGDHIALRAIKENPSAHIVGLRYFNVYGPREGFKGKMASMVWQLYNQMKAGKKPRIFKFGEQKRDFVYVKDIVQANIKALDAPPGVYNAGTGKPEDFNKIIAELNKNMNLNLETEYFDNPYDFYQDFTQADLTRTASWGYVPEYDLEKGIKDYVAWIREEEKITNKQK